ncbi:MAG: tetratricopeptide repeat protein [Chloroflexi bacterium]|nr:MAG: tetratricopeptide repeat protein [Chloroflexota bacterium]
MAKKKTTHISVSQEDTARAQRVFEQYHQIAAKLHESTDGAQVETALTDINDMPEAAQVALLKALSKEHHTDAADILLALNELSSIKDIRKEARRSLIQLEGARVYPGWKPPIERTPIVQAVVPSNPPRFWRGQVTDSLGSGEVQLILTWEQGDDYKDVRILGFLLDFMYEGVKDFFTSIQSKRSFEKLAARMETEMPGVKIKECSLARGRRLLLDALAANQRHGTQPSKDYRYQQALIKQLILDAPIPDDEDIDLDEDEEVGEDYLDLDEDEEDEYYPDLDDLNPQSVVTTFVESWVNGDFDVSYDLLSSDSPLREGLSQEEWMDRRDVWFDEANPIDLEPGIIFEREPQKPRLWLPNRLSAGRAPTNKVIEAGWSIELDESSIDSEPLPEMPQATAVYEETGRHWFWASYSLVQEEGAWRIQSMTDEGINALNLSIEELQKIKDQHIDRIGEITRKHKPSDKNAPQYALEMLQHLMQAASYMDVLVKKLPGNPSVYEEAVAHLFMLGQFERGLVYLEPLTDLVDEDRARNLRRMSAAHRELSAKYFDQGDDERGEHFRELDEENLRESLALEDRFETRISLAEILIDKDEDLNEAEDHLLKAKAMTDDPPEVAHIEMHLGEIATEQERFEEALTHYQRVVDIQPDFAESWADLGEAYQALDNDEKAEDSYRHAIELEPHNEDLYYSLSKIYSDQNEPEKAIEAIEDGISANPDSIVLHLYLATMYMDSGDYRQAEIFLEKAERIDPDSESVMLFRQVLNLTKTQQRIASSKLSTSKKKKRR